MLIIGGAVGAIISYIISLIFLQPIYVAESRISVSINFKQVGHLTQYEQDQMIGNVTSLFQTSDTIDEVLGLLNDDELNTSNFLNHCFIERQVNEIYFRCKSEDPSKSLDWSSTWADVAYQKLFEAYEHAVEYEKLSGIQDDYETCVEGSILIPPVSLECSKLLPDDISSEELSQTLKNEFQLSKNIHTGFVFSEVIPATLPERSFRYGTNTLVIIGTLLGVILSLFYVLNIDNEKQ